MTQETRKSTRLPGSKNLFARLLDFWSEYRRFILLAIIAIALWSFLGSLSETTRRMLVVSLFRQRALIILLLSFTVLTLSLLLSAGQRLDTWIFLLFNLRGYHPLWLDRIMWVFTQIGNGAAGLLLGIFLYFTGNRSLGVQLLLGILSLWMAVELIKIIVERARPFLILEGTRVIGWRERGKSFPSGHTSQAFFMATLLSHSLHVGPMVGSLIYGIAVIVGFTRIYVGAHYPRDVIAGAILGGVWGIMSGLVEAYLTTGQF